MDNRFDGIASQWDQDGPRVRMAEAIAQAMLRVLRLGPDCDLLDFGAGTGLVTLRLQPYVRKVFAFDTSAGMLGTLQDKLAQNCISNVEVIQGTPEASPVLPAVDIIVSSMTLHHVRDVADLARTFKTALRPGGQLALADLDLDGGLFHSEHADVLHSGFDRGQLGGILTGAGFSSVEFRDATVIEKPGADGVVRPFTVFLVTGQGS